MIDHEDDDESYPVPTSKRMAKISQKTDTDMDYSQWQVGANGKFRAAAQTIPHLHPGVYKIDQDDMGPFLQLQTVISDNIVELPETANVRVLSGMKKFWQSQDRYNQFGLVYKRGVLLWGPPGSGKSVTINLLMQELISLKGIVLLCGHPDLLSHMLQRVRGMETDRPIIVVLEDIDEIIDKHGEHAILSMLDGENQIANVVYLATTNYPDKLGARIVNRPSRFDERIFVGMPKAVARKAYLKFATTIKNNDGTVTNGLDENTLDLWTKDTKDFSIAHLRELVAASFCLDQPYEAVVDRLRKMSEKPKWDAGSGRTKSGFMTESDSEDDVGVQTANSLRPPPSDE
jgi:ATPase family associated with various cellular activities (AAA)